jgi:trk system potassium uptake protein TrkA
MSDPMRVIIIGAGHDGAYLAERLIAEGQDVVVVEAEEEKAAKTQDRLDALVIAGNGASPSVLKEAGAERAQLLLAVTDNDGANMMACHSAKALGTRRTVARVEDMDLREVSPGLGVDVIIDARESTAREVLGLVRYHGVSDLVEFAGGRLALVGGGVRADSIAAGYSVVDLRHRQQEREWVLAALVRDGRTMMGRGQSRFEVGDRALLMVRSEDVQRATDLIGIHHGAVRRVVILGGTRIAEMAAALMIRDRMDVVIVEAEADRAGAIARRSDAMVIHGNPTEPEVLDRLDLGFGDVVVALSGWDEVNLMGCLVARAVGAPHTIARFGRLQVAGLLDGVGIDATVSSRVAVANAILRYVRRDRILSVATFKGTSAEAMEIEVAPDAPSVGRTLAELPIPDEAVVGGFIRGTDVFLPTGDSVIQGRDHLVVLSAPGSIEEVEGLFAGR